MSATPEDVKVRLSPEGIDDIVKALRSIEKESDRAGRSSAASFKRVSAAGIDLRRTLVTLGIAGAVTGALAFIKTTARMADEAGKAAQSLGTTTEGLSTLRAEAGKANLENAQLEQGLTNLTDSVGNLIKGTKEQTNAFSRLGITIDDLKGKDTAEQFALIANRVSKFGDTASKTRAIIDIFGKRVGPQLIPLLNQLGTKGFAKAREEAERFGLVLDSQTAASAAAVNDSFQLMGSQVRGLAFQFLDGLAPVVATVMEDFREDTAGKGVNAMQEFGASTGKTLRDTIFLFQFTGRSVGLFFANLFDHIQTLNAHNKAVLRGNIDEAKKLVAEFQSRKLARGDAFTEDIDALKATRAASEERARLLVEEAKARAAARQALNDQLQALEFQEASLEKRKKVQEEFDKLDKEFQQRQEEMARKTKTANEEREKIEIDLLELTGQQREAKIATLDAELLKQRQIFAEAGLLTAQQEERLEKLRDVKIASINFEDVKEKGEQALNDLAIARERIEQDVQLGITTQLGGQQRILALEQERLPILQQLATAALAAAAATGSPEAIAAAEAFAAKVRDVKVSVDSISDASIRLKQGLEESLQGGIKSLLTNIGDIKSVEDAFRSLASTVLESLAQIAADILAKQATFALLKAFGFQSFSTGGPVSGGTVNAASGGFIRGPGTATSDSIPARLSDGEFVVNAKAVSQPGVLDMLHALNRRVRVPRMTPRRYADGGLVEGPVGGAGDKLGRLEVGLEEGLIARLVDTPEGSRAVIKMMNRNRRSLNF